MLYYLNDTFRELAAVCVRDGFLLKDMSESLSVFVPPDNS